MFESNFLRFPTIFILSVFFWSVEKADREHVEHGFSGKFKKEHGNLVENDKHNMHADHKVVLGSRKEAEIFDDLSSDEAKRRLALVAKRMDSDNDGYVSREELEKVIKQNMMALDLEESNERFREMDMDQDNFVTWDEYVKEAYGEFAPENENIDADDKRLMEEDRKFFFAADVDKDEKLSNDEFHAFQNPESYDHMHSTLIENTMVEKDKNQDGKITLDEFLDELATEKDSEWYNVEKNRFEQDYDTDKNGVLEGPEIALWLVMTLNTTAAEETDHLISKADSDGDGRLTIDEIVNESDLFVGSEATNHGEKLAEISHDEL